MKKLYFFLGSPALLFVGIVLIVTSGWRTSVQDFADQYTTTEKVVYEVGLPSGLKSTLQGLGLLFAAGSCASLYLGLKASKPELDRLALGSHLSLAPSLLPEVKMPIHIPSVQEQKEVIKMPRPTRNDVVPQPQYFPVEEVEDDDDSFCEIPPKVSKPEIKVNIGGTVSLPRRESQAQENNNIDFGLFPGIVDCSDPEKKKKLIALVEKLFEPENDFVVPLLKASPLHIWGEQGAGKTAFCSFLILLRHLLFQLPVEIIDPHAHLNVAKGVWPLCFPVYGWKNNFNVVNNRLSAYFARIEDANCNPTVMVFDEITNYSENCALAPRLLKSLCSDSRKSETYVITLGHNDTLSTMGGGIGGTNKMKENGMVFVHLLADRSVLGEHKFSGKGSIKGLAKDTNGNPMQKPIILQDWMHPNYLFNLFPELESVHKLNGKHIEPAQKQKEDEVLPQQLGDSLEQQLLSVIKERKINIDDINLEEE